MSTLFENALERLEWSKILDRLYALCLTPYGYLSWRDHAFLLTAEAVQKHQNMVDALKFLLVRYGDVIGDTDIPDIDPQIRRLAKGGFLSLTDMGLVLKAVTLGCRYFSHFRQGYQREMQLTSLQMLMGDVVMPVEVQRYLESFLECDNRFTEFALKETASPKIQAIRQSIQHGQRQVQHKIDQLLRNPDCLMALQSTSVTERDGRLVFPVKVEFKNKMPGVIHGVSASGATVFVEPKPLLELNNQLQGFYAELQKETDRIVKQMSVELQQHWEVLERFCEGLGQLDRHLAAARLSRLLRANLVELNTEKQCLHLLGARHPLLVLQNKNSKESVVANDVVLDRQDVRTIVITGPNTGGKTVLLKLVGLFSLMLRAGLHLPVSENSSMSLFDPVLVDIGDQQNITQNLSTFSAHMNQLTQFVDPDLDLSRGLVLLDEIAAGTDPVEGAAIAKAILEELYRKGAVTLVTTHLSSLKVDAHRHVGFINASVAFDVESLSPTYKLLIGIPGASNGIIIAEKLGLNASVIEAARLALSAPARESADLLQELESKNQQAREELERSTQFRLEAQAAFEKIDQERQTLEREKRQLLRQFQTTLKSQIHDLERQVKDIRKDLQQGKTDQLDMLGSQLNHIGRDADRAFAEARTQIEPVHVLKVDDLKVGETVFSKQLDLKAEVDSILTSSQEVVIRAGILKATVPVSDLQKVQQSQSKTVKKKKKKMLTRSYHVEEGKLDDEVTLNPSVQCDIRGLNAEDALLRLDSFLDEALRQGLHGVSVIHGMGTGVLRQAVRRHLAASSYVKRYYPAQATQGGDGKTIVQF